MWRYFNKMRPEVQRWFLQSKEEFQTAKVSFDGQKWFAAAFWCQQAVEKALKALYIVKRKESSGTTHSLTFLGREVGVPQEFNYLLRDLTKEYYLSRYPDATEDVPYKFYNSEEVKKYLIGTEKVIKWVESQLEK